MESMLLSGNLKIDRLTAAGLKTGLVDAGNTVKVEIQSNADIKQQLGKGRDNYGQPLASATLNKPAVFKVGLNQLAVETAVLILLGESAIVNVAAGSVSAETVAFLALDRSVRMAHRNITDGTVVVSKTEAIDAPDWASEHVYALNAIIVPTTPNGHYYKCTTAGTSGTTEPATWKTDGTTVTDGTAVWTDQGLAVMVEGTDYSVINRTGEITPLTGGAIEANESVTVAYDYGASTGWKVRGSVQPTIKAYLFFDGYNLVNGNNVEMECWKIQLKPTSPIDLMSDEFVSFELEGSPEIPTGRTEPYILQQFAA